jgi:protein-S-isoprenylcysteine O-methyltransferase Ste14
MIHLQMIHLQMIRFPKTYADTVARLRVPSGFLIVAVFAWISHPTWQSMAMGLPAGLLGLALRAWAAGCLAKNQQLATRGPYAHTRNPLYIGTLLVAAGLSMASRSLFLALLFTAVFLLIYLPVIQNEEQHLRKIFPDYAGYAERVPALWPRLSPAAKESSNRFRASQYLKNEEYKAGLGFTAGMLFLLWKMRG